MKRCIHCKNNIDEHYRICPYCGENQDYATAINNPPLTRYKLTPEEKKVELDRPSNYSLIVFVTNSLLMTALAYLLVKQWKSLPLVFLFTLGAQYGLALGAYGLGRLAFSLETDFSLFFDIVGDYSLPGVLVGTLLLFGNFFLPVRLVFFLLVFNVSLIFSASLSALLGPAKRVYALVSGFVYLLMLLAIFLFRWLFLLDLVN